MCSITITVSPLNELRIVECGGDNGKINYAGSSEENSERS
jgi:hypothetical protein